MTRNQILEHAYASAADFTSALTELVTRESPTHDIAACDALADYLEATLRRDGFSVKRHPLQAAGDLLEGRLAGPGNGPRTLLLTHYDTVWPLGTLEVMPLRETDGIIYGPGVLDMKSGIAAALTALKIVRELDLTLAGDVTLLLTSDEETGSLHSRALIEELAGSHDRVLVLEPCRDDGALKVGRKGVGDFELHLSGRSAHAGNNPADGASALRELAHLLLYVEDLADEVAGTTVNVTMAKAGFAGNVIAELVQSPSCGQSCRARANNGNFDAVAGHWTTRFFDPAIFEGLIDDEAFVVTNGDAFVVQRFVTRHFTRCRTHMSSEIGQRVRQRQPLKGALIFITPDKILPFRDQVVIGTTRYCFAPCISIADMAMRHTTVHATQRLLTTINFRQRQFHFIKIQDPSLGVAPRVILARIFHKAKGI